MATKNGQDELFSHQCVFAENREQEAVFDYLFLHDTPMTHSHGYGEMR